jgi:hypothetical protein
MVLLAVVSAVAFSLAGKFSDGTLHGGHVFPRMMSALIFVLAIISLIFERPTLDDQALSWKPVAVVALTLAFLGLMPTIGYPLMAPLWVVATIWLFGLRNLYITIPIGVGLSAIAWILLDRLAFAPPPAGLFEIFL